MPAPFRLPAEWEPHEATLLAWPTQTEDWPGKFQPIPWVFAEIIRHLSAGEDIHLLVPEESRVARVRRMLDRAHADLSRVHFLTCPLDRGWMRDCSPAITVHAGVRRAVQFGFNGWAKYENWQLDAQAAPFLARHTGSELVKAMRGDRHVILEGGAIDSNGAGTLLTTEECLLDEVTQTRNPGFTKAEYEAVFRESLGVEDVIWLGKGIAGDDTHGHVDDLCRFVNESTVVLCRESTESDANYRPLEENWERLSGIRDARGGSIDAIALPMPAPLYFEGVRLPASYANFYIGNEAVLVPTFNDPADRDALGILGELFSDRRVVGIHAVDLVWGFGTIHCLSHELPAIP